MFRLPVRPWRNRTARPAPRGRRRTARPTRHRSHLVLEFLEGRCVPSTVTNLADAGAGSLRQAILDTPTGGAVDFQQGLAGTVTLMTGELVIAKDLTIAGPGADVITVSGNHASRVFNIAATFTVDISGLTIANGSVTGTGTGGGIYNSGTLTITNATLSGNSASLEGGGIENWEGMLTITNATLSGNKATGSTALGGGIDSYSGRVTVTNATLSGNSAGRLGGGIYLLYGTVTVTNSTLSDNSAISTVGGGGGIYNGGTLTVTSSTLSGNTAPYGGGIENDASTLIVTNSTLSGGLSTRGGGIYTTFGTVTVTSSTLSGNFASSAGGIYNSDGAVTVTSSTLSGNTATGSVGGIYNAGFHTVTSRNTIVAGNTAPSFPDVLGLLNSQGHNLIGDGTGGSSYTDTDLVGTSDIPIDPLLGPLQDNGGPTQTMVALAGSPSIDIGDPVELGVADQRGVVRTGGVNIGAFQASASTFGLAAPDTVSAGVPFDMTVAAVDIFGQVAVGYRGTVTFTSSDLDSGVVLPADYAFTPDDGGVHIFTDTGLGETTLITPGDQLITVTDMADGTISGSATVTVSDGTGPLPRWGDAARQSVKPSTSPAQLPTRQSPEGPSEGQPARPETAPASGPLFAARHAQDAVFEGLGDPLVAGMAASLMQQG